MPQVNPEPPNPIPPTPTGSNADDWCWLISECSAAYVAVQIAERIEAVERERDELRALRDKWADAALAADKRAEAAEAREKGLREALEKIAGRRGEYSMPWPDAQPCYAGFAVVTARQALDGDDAARCSKAPN